MMKRQSSEELDTAYRDALCSQRAALIGLLRDGVIPGESYAQLAAKVDEALMDENPSRNLFDL